MRERELGCFPTDKGAELFPVSVFIKEEMEARGWTEKDLADAMHFTERGVREILAGNRPITTLVSMALGDAFGVGPALFKRIDLSYRNWRDQQPREDLEPTDNR